MTSLARLAPVAACLVLAGCSTKIWVTQYPDFYDPGLKTIAVLPFQGPAGDKGSGQIVSDQLANSLRANGTYAVFNRNEIAALVKEADLAELAGASTDALAVIRRQAEVQAVLTGTVSEFAATQDRQQRQEPVMVWSEARRQMVPSGQYRTYVHSQNAGHVAVTAVLMRPDGATIHATGEPAWARVASEGSPPGKDPGACRSQALDMVIARLVETFAVVRKQISVSKKAVRTAGELYDNKWTYQSQFNSQDEKMYVVIALPPEADRNKFKIVIVRKDQRDPLAEQEVTWSRQHATFGYQFSPKQIAAAGGGPGDYTVKFYSGPEPVLTTDFSIR